MRATGSKIENNCVAMNPPKCFSSAPTSYTLAHSRCRKKLELPWLPDWKFEGGMKSIFLNFGGSFLDADRGSFFNAD
jgi:hypothetical protein